MGSNIAQCSTTPSAAYFTGIPPAFCRHPRGAIQSIGDLTRFIFLVFDREIHKQVIRFVILVADLTIGDFRQLKMFDDYQTVRWKLLFEADFQRSTLGNSPIHLMQFSTFDHTLFGQELLLVDLAQGKQKRKWVVKSRLIRLYGLRCHLRPHDLQGATNQRHIERPCALAVSQNNKLQLLAGFHLLKAAA